MKNEMNAIFDKVIENNNFYGRSFTLGQALYEIMEYINGYFNEEQQTQLDEIIDAYYGEMISDLYKSYNIDVRYNYRALREMLDISVLDEIARELTGENEEEE